MTHRWWRWTAVAAWMMALALALRVVTPVAAQGSPVEVILNQPAVPAGNNVTVSNSPPRCPSRTVLAMSPPVPIVSSSGWAWVVMSVSRRGSVIGGS